MGKEENKKFAQTFLEALSRGDWQFVEDAYAEDVVIWTAAPELFPSNGSFPEGLKFTVKAMTAEGERVAIEAESYGKHISGKIYNNLYHFLMVIRNGKISELKEYMDTMHANEVLLSE